MNSDVQEILHAAIADAADDVCWCSVSETI